MESGKGHEDGSQDKERVPLKKIGTYTVRGQMAESTEVMIQLFDGRFDTGYRVVDVMTASSDIGSTADDLAIRISICSIGAMPTSGDMIDFADNRQIAWCGSTGASNSWESVTPIIDPDNLIIENMWISGQHGTSDRINYMIILEKWEFSEAVGALTMSTTRASDSATPATE